MSLEERFWAKVDRRGPDDCWLWTGSVMGTGYGNIKVNARVGNTYAHRLAYELHKGHIPPEMTVDHSCFNRRCVNPEHLRLATLKQNNENQKGAKSHSSTGIRGVYFDSRRGTWSALVTHNRKPIYLGTFARAEDAAEAARAKRNELFTHNIQDRKSA